MLADSDLLRQLGSRPFSFYPPILGIEHNEWTFQQGAWSEILVHNTKSSEELWVPRRFVSGVSQVDEPVMIVGLNKQLECKSGRVSPHEKRVIQMPKPNTPPPATEQEAPAKFNAAQVAGIRMERGEGKLTRVILGALALGILACFLVISFFRGGKIEYQGVLQADLGFTAFSNYHDVIRKLGPPGSDRWKPGDGERQYRALEYANQDLTVILMGTDRESATYVGAMNKNWKPVHSVTYQGRGNTRALLQQLARF